MLGVTSPIHWIILLGVAGLLFGGRGKLSSIMGDAAKGIRAFKDGLKGEEETPPATVQPTPQIAPTRVEPVSTAERDRSNV